MPSMILTRILVAVLGTALIIILFPLVILSVIFYFVRTAIRATQCVSCGKWIENGGELCRTCFNTMAERYNEMQDEINGPWASLKNDDSETDMPIALATDENGVLHIGAGMEDPMTIEWKILGRDM